MRLQRLLLIAAVACLTWGGAFGADLAVGVYSGTGDEGILAALDAAQGIQAQKLEWLSPETLGRLQAVIIPHGAQVGVRDQIMPWRAVLRRYVELGGGLVLTHNAVGFRGVFAGEELFSEIETSAGRNDAWTVHKAPDSSHPLALQLPDSIRHGYSDHITMHPGPLGQVICVDERGDPTAVAGEFGAGRVVAMGVLVGWRATVQELKHYEGESAAPEGAERALLVESVRWAGSDEGLNAATTTEELATVAGQPTGKPLVVFASNFSSYNLSPDEWTVPPDLPNGQKTWRGHGVSEDLGQVGEVFTHEQPLVARPFRKAPLTGRFVLNFSVVRSVMYGGTLDIVLTNPEGWGYGARLVYISADDQIDGAQATRRDSHQWQLDIGDQTNGIFRIEKGALTTLANATDERARVRMSTEQASKIPACFQRTADGWLTLRVDGRVIAAAQDTTYDEFDNLSLTLITPQGRLAVDDMQLVGYFTEIEEKPVSPPPVVLPQPRKMNLTGDKFALADGAQFVLASEDKVASYCLEELIEDIQAYYGVKLAPVVRGNEDANLPAIQVGELSAPDPQLGTEGYILEVTATSAKVQGATEAGTFYGLQSLFQLIARENDSAFIRGVTIRDWPDLQWRGAHSVLLKDTFLRPRVQTFKDQVKMMARLKGNVLIVGSRRLPFPSCPQVAGYDCYWTIEEFAELAQYAHDHHIDVWPQVSGLSHSGWLVADYVQKRSPEFWAWMEEHQVLGIFKSASENYHADAFNPGSPEAIELILKITDDILEAIPFAKVAFIGMDEILPPISEMVPDRDPADVLTEYISKHHAHLAQRDVRMGLWADHLLEYGKFEGSCASSGSPHYKDLTHAALDRIPQDIIVGDWYYATKPGRPSYAYLKSKGFDVFGMPGSCNGNIYESVYYSAREAKKAGINGIISFGWQTSHHLNPQVTYILPFIYAWTVPEEMEPDWSMQEVWQDFYQDRRPSRLGQAESIDISTAMNESRCDEVPDDGVGWLDYGKAADLSGLPAGELIYDDLRFNIVDEDTNNGNSAVIVATEDANTQVGQKVEGIPVDSKAESLIFLHIANQGPHSKPIGQYVIHYQDGTTAEVPIVYGQNIGPWLFEKGHTSGFYGLFYKYGYFSECRRAYVGATQGGERVALQSYEWVNPHPDKTIESVDLVVFAPPEYMKDRDIRIALLALSCVR